MRTSTGLYSLDFVLGGGFEDGSLVEIHGPPSSGLTTLGYYLIGEAQARGKLCAYIDATHDFFAPWARENGVVTEQLIHHWPINGEECFEVACQLVERVKLLVLDGVAMVTPHSELQEPLSEHRWRHAIGAQKRLLAHGLEELKDRVGDCIVLLLNQVRVPRGKDWKKSSDAFAETTFMHLVDMRARMEKARYIDHDYQRVGTVYKITCVDNRFGPHGREASFEILRDWGVSREGDVLDAAIRCGIVLQSGSWFKHGEHSLGQGREAARLYLADHPSHRKVLENEINKGLPDGC